MSDDSTFSIYEPIALRMIASEIRAIYRKIRFISLVSATDDSKVEISTNGASFFPLLPGTRLSGFEIDTLWIRNTSVAVNTITIGTGMAVIDDNKIRIDTSSALPVTVLNTSIGVVGPVADGIAVSGNPVRIGGKDSGGLTQDVMTDTDGTLFVGGRNANGNSIGAGALPVIVAGSDGANIRTLRTDVAGNQQVVAQGVDAHNAGFVGFPVSIGAESRTTNRAATSDTRNSRPIVDKLGRQVVVNGNIRELCDNTRLAITASVAETTLIAAVASVTHDIVSVILANSGASGTLVDFRDSTAGTIRFSVWVPAGASVVVPFPTPCKQNAVNQNWTAQCSVSTSSLIISTISVRTAA